MANKRLSHCNPGAQHMAGECATCDFYESRLSMKYQFPHCDAYVVHEPGDCDICDKYAADLQKWRLDNNVNFTGETSPNKAPCPATLRRDIKKINRWSGNSPQPKRCSKCGVVATYINLALACPQHGPV